MFTNNNLKVALAGIHRQVEDTPGGHNWASAFAEVPDTKVVAIYDKDQKTRDEFQDTWLDTWGEMHQYNDYNDMIESVKPDIVCIATRQTYHAEHIESAVKHGVRGLVCDKPLCTDLNESDRIIKVLRESETPFTFGLELRWSESYQAIFQMLREGIIGNVTSVVAHGVTELINHGCHFYDVALGMVGDPEPVSAIGIIDNPETFDDWRQGDPHGRGWISLDNGVNLGIMSEGEQRSYTITGSDGRMTVMNEGELVYLWENNIQAKKFSDKPRKIEVPKPSHPWPRGPASIRDLVDKIKKGGRTLCDVEETRRATEIGFAIHASNLLDGARVSFPVKNRSIKIDSRPWGND